MCVDATHRTKYEGNYRSSLFHGQGTLVFLNSGDYYTGEFEEGFYHGNGIYHNEKENWTHEGLYRRGKREGYGTLLRENGDEYKGWFTDDKMEVS